MSQNYSKGNLSSSEGIESFKRKRLHGVQLHKRTLTLNMGGKWDGDPWQSTEIRATKGPYSGFGHDTRVTNMWSLPRYQGHNVREVLNIHPGLGKYPISSCILAKRTF